MLADLLSIFTRWRVWLLMGHQDIRLRYKRSYLGPFWISISLAATIIGVSFLYSEIFKVEAAEYALYLAGGLIAWNFIQGTLSDSTSMIIDEVHHLRAVKITLPIIAARVVYRNLIILMHNMVVGVAVVYLTGHKLTWDFLWFFPGLLALVTIMLFAALAIAPICARYRDLPEIIRNFLLLMFFLTPIFWMEGQAGRKSYFVDYNPFQSLVNLIRMPLIGREYGEVKLMTIGIAVALFIPLGLISLKYARNRLYNWL